MEKYNFNIPSEVLDILAKLHTKYEAYIVGGCVRDLLLDRTPNDYDITTNATPEQIKEVFNGSDYELINNNGEKHGTVTVRYLCDNYEITTYRIDGDYSDNRHPDSVEFTQDIVKDLARRDFTINAMAYADGKLIDPFGGEQDLHSKIIRTVGNPTDRFNEDGLRILRGIRFAARFNFNIDSETMLAMYENRNLLNGISKERIHKEIVEIFNYEAIGRLMQYYYVLDVIALIIPEFDEINPSLFKLCGNGGYMENLAALFSRVGCAFPNERLPKLAFSKLETKTISILTEEFDFKSDFRNPATIISTAHRLIDDQKLCEEKAYQILVHLVSMQYSFASVSDIDYKEKALQAISNTFATECICIKKLAINGNNLIDIGYRNEEIGHALRDAFYAVVYEGLPNTYKDIINYLS